VGLAWPDLLGVLSLVQVGPHKVIDAHQSVKVI